MIRFVDKDPVVAKDDSKVVLFGGKRGGAMSDAVAKKITKTGAAKKAAPKTK
jgi:hypothetical protein